MHQVVIVPVILHHLLYSDDPERTEQHEGHHIVPIVVSVQALLSVVDWFFQCLHFAILLVEDSLHLFQCVVFVQGQLVYFAHENCTQNVVERHWCAHCDQGCPQDHDWSLAVSYIMVQNSQDAAVPWKSDQHESGSGKFGEVIFMTQKV